MHIANRIYNPYILIVRLAVIKRTAADLGKGHGPRWPSMALPLVACVYLRDEHAYVFISVCVCIVFLKKN
jgi:hypothetical protein